MLDTNALARRLVEQVVMLVWGLASYSHRHSTQIALSSLTRLGGSLLLVTQPPHSQVQLLLHP